MMGTHPPSRSRAPSGAPQTRAGCRSPAVQGSSTRHQCSAVCRGCVVHQCEWMSLSCGAQAAEWRQQQYSWQQYSWQQYSVCSGPLGSAARPAHRARCMPARQRRDAAAASSSSQQQQPAAAASSSTHLRVKVLRLKPRHALQPPQRLSALLGVLQEPGSDASGGSGRRGRLGHVSTASAASVSPLAAPRQPERSRQQAGRRARCAAHQRGAVHGRGHGAVAAVHGAAQARHREAVGHRGIIMVQHQVAPGTSAKVGAWRVAEGWMPSVTTAARAQAAAAGVAAAAVGSRAWPPRPGRKLDRLWPTG